MILVSDEQSTKAKGQIVVTESGITMLVSDEQFTKAEGPIVVILYSSKYIS